MLTWIGKPKHEAGINREHRGVCTYQEREKKAEIEGRSRTILKSRRGKIQLFTLDPPLSQSNRDLEPVSAKESKKQIGLS